MNQYGSLPGFHPWSAWHVASTASTMEDARILSGKADRGFVIADFQSSGRGRIDGRRWQSDAGQSLLVSFWLPASDFKGAPPSLICGLALRSACLDWAKASKTRLELCIKWPNDLYSGGRKLAGILCESFRNGDSGDAESRTVVAGFGLNLTQPSFSGEYRCRPCSVLTECGLAPSPMNAVAYLARAMASLPVNGWMERLNACLHGRGAPVRFRDGLGDGREVSGILAGIAPDGSLLIDCGKETVAFASGELVL